MPILQQPRNLLNYDVILNAKLYENLNNEVSFGEIKLRTFEQKGAGFGTMANVGLELMEFEMTIDGRDPDFMAVVGSTVDIQLRGSYLAAGESVVGEVISARVCFNALDPEKHKPQEQNTTKLVGNIEKLYWEFGKDVIFDIEYPSLTFFVGGKEVFPGLKASTSGGA